MTGGGKGSCQSKEKDGNASSETSSSQSVDLNKVYAQMEEIEKQNQQMMKEIDDLNRKKG